MARDLELETGGMTPHGWVTKFGPRPQLAKLGLIEHPTSDKYPPRTGWNVKNSDATIRFAHNFDSAGEICTLKAIKKYGKPYFDVDIRDLILGENLYIIDVVEWFHANNVTVLNVAGNCGNTKAIAKVIYDITRHSLRAYVSAYNKISQNPDVWKVDDLS